MSETVALRMEPAGADAVLIHFAALPGAQLSRRIAACSRYLETELGAIALDAVAGWDTLLIHYDVRRIGYHSLVARLQPLIECWQAGLQSGGEQDDANRHHVLPVWYCGEDLEEVAAATGLAVHEVIEVHASAEYFVGAVGFAPGFAYMGGLDRRLMLPRRTSPRTTVPKGSVAITEGQTSIYPEQSPGGWHLLGRCPLRLYDPERSAPGRFSVGDRVSFMAIDGQLFNILQDRWQWDPDEHASVGDTTTGKE